MMLGILKLSFKSKIKIKKLGVGILVLLLGFFIFQKEIRAESKTEIIINEVMYNSESSEGDWVELYNLSNKDINIKEWRLIDEYDLKLNKKGDKYLNCHIISKDDFIIKKGEYIIIGKKGGDLILKSLSLKNNNKDAVRISDNNCESFVSEIKYDPEKKEKVDKGFSLELDNSKWRQSYIVGGTPGEKNSKKPEPKKYSKSIKVNEIFPDPKKDENKNEWIELYNFGDNSVDLENWVLIDESGKKFKLKGEIGGGEYLVFYSAISLNNSGDKIVLENPNKEKVGEVEYKKSKEGFSYSYDARDKKWKWSTFLTPGNKNKFDEDIIYPNKIKINEILPNPSGEENNDEFIELYNYGKEKIKLNKWVLRDSSKMGKYIFSEDKIISPGSYLKIYRKDFKFALNNSGGEVVYLLNPKNEEVFRVAYNSAREDISYGYDAKNKKWRWSRFLTPGTKNKFDKIPEIKIDIDDNIYKNMYANFKVKIKDVNEKDLKIKWDFGDDRRSYKKETRHKYKKEGDYKVLVEVFNGSEEFVFKKIIKVKKFPKYNVEIVSFIPNPKGKDIEGEWIEVRNNYKRSIDFENWSIATGKDEESSVNHPINEKFKIKSGETQKITREYSYFSLNNKEGFIELRYPNGKIADSVGYKKEGGIKDNEIYIKNENGEWEWVNLGIIIEGSVEDNDVKEEVLGVESIVDEFIGKKSFVGVDKNIIFFKKLKIEKEILSLFWESDLKPRLENNIYYFNPVIKNKKHYLFKFFEDIFHS